MFFDNVCVLKMNCVGEENVGWMVVKYLFEFEWGGGNVVGWLWSVFNWLKGFFNEEGDVVFLDKFVCVEICVDVL